MGRWGYGGTRGMGRVCIGSSGKGEFVGMNLVGGLLIRNMNPKKTNFQNGVDYPSVIRLKNHHFLKAEVGFFSDKKVFRRMAKCE